MGAVRGLWCGGVGLGVSLWRPPPPPDSPEGIGQDVAAVEAVDGAPWGPLKKGAPGPGQQLALRTQLVALSLGGGRGSWGEGTLLAA